MLASVGRQVTQCMVDAGASASLVPKTFGLNKSDHIDNALTLKGVDGMPLAFVAKLSYLLP